MASALAIAEYRAANAGIVSQVQADLEDFWGSLDLNRPERARDQLLAYLPVLTDEYGEIAAALALDWFDELRLDASGAGLFAMVGAAASFQPVLAALTPRGAVESQVRFGAQHLFTDRPDQTLAFLQGETQKYVLQPGRDTIATNSVDDPAANGWRRVVRVSGCDFCRRQRERGAIFTQRSAQFKAHHDCNCAAEPVWGR
ncbi:hypothetical protein UQW22_09925 [Isoptericola halotolerans]|uniref:VG15 protein n=1 Tax=Isoptericola halotolerans TaxID=300560 RepID=UPI00388DC607